MAVLEEPGNEAIYPKQIGSKPMGQAWVTAQMNFTGYANAATELKGLPVYQSALKSVLDFAKAAGTPVESLHFAEIRNGDDGVEIIHSGPDERQQRQESYAFYSRHSQPKRSFSTPVLMT